MFDRLRTSRLWLTAATFASVLSFATGTTHAAVTVAVTPGTATVLPNTFFDVLLEIPTAGSAFNGFSVVLSYNPAVLTFVPSTPLNLQEGCLMNGGCSAACGSTLHDFRAAGDSLVVNDYLFCNLVAISGPGQLYKLRFLTKPAPNTTSISIRRATFYNAGVLVTPVNSSNATVTIPANTGVGDGAAVTHSLRVEPNPAHGRLQLVLDEAGSGSAEADILDLQGRLVRSLGTVNAGPRARVDWDGTDRDGRAAPGGLYLARIVRAGKVQTSRFILLR